MPMSLSEAVRILDDHPTMMYDDARCPEAIAIVLAEARTRLSAIRSEPTVLTACFMPDESKSSLLAATRPGERRVIWSDEEKAALRVGHMRIKGVRTIELIERPRID